MADTNMTAAGAAAAAGKLRKLGYEVDDKAMAQALASAFEAMRDPSERVVQAMEEDAGNSFYRWQAGMDEAAKEAKGE